MANPNARVKTTSSKGIVGAVIGAILGSFIGNPLLGASLGYTIGTAFEDVELPPGPRLENIDINDSSFGKSIPRVYGRDRLSGNIFWMQENKLIEVTRTETQRNKLLGFTVSKTTQEITEYFASFAIGVCEGQIKRIVKIYANDEVIWSDNASDYQASSESKVLTTLSKPISGTFIGRIPEEVINAARPNLRVYRGDLDQEADPLIVEQEGANAPAFRGMAYVVVERLALSNGKFLNRIPDISFEVERYDVLEPSPKGDPTLYHRTSTLTDITTGASGNIGFIYPQFTGYYYFPNNGTIRVARSYFPTPFSGTASNFVGYNRELSDSEFLTLSQSGTPLGRVGPPTGVIANNTDVGGVLPVHTDSYSFGVFINPLVADDTGDVKILDTNLENIELYVNNGNLRVEIRYWRSNDNAFTVLTHTTSGHDFSSSAGLIHIGIHADLVEGFKLYKDGLLIHTENYNDTGLLLGSKQGISGMEPTAKNTFFKYDSSRGVKLGWKGVRLLDDNHAYMEHIIVQSASPDDSLSYEPFDTISWAYSFSNPTLFPTRTIYTSQNRVPIVSERYSLDMVASPYFNSGNDNSFGETAQVKLNYLDGDITHFYPTQLPYVNTLAGPVSDLDTSKPVRVFPVLNSKDLYIILWHRGEGAVKDSGQISIGKRLGSALAIKTLYNFEPGRYFDEVTNPSVLFNYWNSRFDENNNTASVNIGNPSFLDTSYFKAVFLKGAIFLCYSDPRKSMPFPGLIRIPLSNDWSFFDQRKVDKIVQYGNTYFRNDGDTYIVEVSPSGPAGTRGGDFITDWRWIVDYDFFGFAIDHESETLYGLEPTNPSIYYESTGRLSHLDSAPGGRIHEIDPDTGRVIRTTPDSSPLDLQDGYNGVSGVTYPYRGNEVTLGRVVAGSTLIMANYAVRFDFTDGFGSFCNTDAPTDFNAGFSLETPRIQPLHSGFSVWPISSGREVSDSFISNHRADGDNNPIYSGAAYAGFLPIQFKVLSTFFTNDLNSYFDNQVTVQELLEAEALKTGILTSSDLDYTNLAGKTINGLTISDRGPVLNTYAAVQGAYLSDVYEEDALIKGRFREDATVERVLDYSDLRASEIGTQAPEISITIPPNFRIPANIVGNFRDASLNYQTNTVYLNNPVANNSATVSKNYPLVLTSDEALKILDQVAKATESSSNGFAEISLTYKHSDLEVSDYIQINLEDGSTKVIRITSIDKGRPGIVKVIGIFDRPGNYASDLVANLPNSTVKIPTLPGPNPIFIDSFGFNSDEDVPGPWIGSYAESGARTSAVSVAVSYDNGNTYNTIGNLSNKTAVASVIEFDNDFANRSETFIDSRFTFTINPISNPDAFKSITEEEILIDETTNTYFLGTDGRWEIIKIQTFTEGENGALICSGLLSGYKGTQHNMGNHDVGDRLVAIDKSLIKVGFPEDFINQGGLARFTFGSPNSNVVEYFYSLNGEEVTPLSVRNVDGYKALNGDWNLSWVRQTRYGNEWLNLGDAILDEDEESYRVYILDPINDNAVIREIIVTETSAVYTDADQVTDWGSSQSSITIAIGQYSNLLQDVGYTTKVTL